MVSDIPSCEFYFLSSKAEKKEQTSLTGNNALHARRRLVTFMLFKAPTLGLLEICTSPSFCILAIDRRAFCSTEGAENQKPIDFLPEYGKDPMYDPQY